MKSFLDLIKALYGPKAISSTIGTRTNVIRLPSGKLQKYLSKELNIEAASDAAAQNAYEEMKQLVPEVAKMNDAERLVFEGNLRRLKNKLEASGLIQGENVSSGITALESKVEQLKQKGKELEKVTGEKVTLTDVLNDLGASQQSMSRLNDEGLVRSTAREILINDIKAGKIKNITVSEAINMGEPLDPFRQIYGEGALEQLDSLIPNLRGLKTEMEAEKLARSKFKFEPDENRLPGSVSIEEGRKAEQEFGINKPAKVSDFKAEATKRTSIDDLIDEYNANQDRLILTDEEGGTAIGYQEFKQLQKRNEEIAKALETKGISSKVEETPQAEIIPFRKKPTEPEGKANGGRIGYAEGTPAAGLVVTNWEGPWTGPQILGGPKPGEYANQRSGITSIQSNRVLKPEYRNGIPIGLVMPQDFYYMDAPSVTNSSSESNPNLSLKDQYLNKLSAIQSSGSSYEDFKNLLESKLQKKANGGSTGLDYLTGQEPPKNGYAGGGRIGYADGNNDAPSITLDSYKDPTLEPLSKYKSYSELEILQNLSAKHPTGDILEENIYENMPIYKPKDVIPKRAIPTMPSEEYLRRRHQLDLASGGRVNLQKGSIPKILEFLIDKLSKEKNFNKTLLEKSSPKAVQDLYIEKYGKLPSAEEIKDIVNKQLQNKGSMEVMNPKTGEVTTPKNPIMTVEDLQFKHKDAFNAHDQINIDIGDKIAPDMIAESMAEIKGKDYFSLSQKEQSDLYKKALAYVDDVRMTKRQNKSLYVKGDAITEENFGNTPFAPSQETLDNLKKAREMTKGMSLHDEMNMVLNQYDKSMFIKNEQGMVDVADPENVRKMALLLKRDHPELYRRLEMEIQPNILEDFDITGRKPNAEGGLNYLMGF